MHLIVDVVTVVVFVDIAEELAHNTSLHKLSLRGNYMHEAAGNCLAQALQLNCSLLKLDVEGNQFPHTVFKVSKCVLTSRLWLIDCY